MIRTQGVPFELQVLELAYVTYYVSLTVGDRHANKSPAKQASSSLNL